jgi:hypothetical protein
MALVCQECAKSGDLGLLLPLSARQKLSHLRGGGILHME